MVHRVRSTATLSFSAERGAMEKAQEEAMKIHRIQVKMLQAFKLTDILIQKDFIQARTTY